MAFPRIHAAASALPAWVVEAAAKPTPTLPAAAPALVLLDEWAYTVEADGRLILARRYAVRVLNRSGNESARFAVGYVDKYETVLEANAWLVRAGKEVRPPTKREWADVSDAGGGAIYDESRKRAISYEDLAFAGDVFACESRVERRLLFGQVAKFWNSSLPTLTDRCVLSLPPGWSCKALLEGPLAPAVKATVAGQSWTWDLNDRPYRPDEPFMADQARLDARVLINLIAPAEGKGPVPYVPRDWAAVAAWDLNNSAGQCDSNPALVASVKKITTECPDALARIRALSRHVQQLRYVGVNKDILLGRGYRPRKATEVFAKGWGDCKDKANLLVAMLREAGVEAFQVSARVGGGRQVNPDWPSLYQFNHAIVGIRVDESVVLPPVVDVAGVGRLLFFDATNPEVLLGDLPSYLQGTKVYVVAPGTTGLTTLPLLPPETSHRFATRVRMVLAPDGSVAGDCEFGGPGRAGAICRAQERALSAKDLRKKLAESLNGSIRGAEIKEVGRTDDPVGGEYWVKFAFAAPHFGQAMPGGLTLVRLDVLTRDSVPTLPEKERRLAVGLDPLVQHDEVTLQLPVGFVVDEVPERTELHSAFGSYQSWFEVTDGSVTVRRTTKFVDGTVPVAEYAALRKFLGDVAKADRAALVIRRREPGVAPAPAAATAP